VSSIRPLATITVLAFVGVFLYLKINETEPPLPEGVEDWSTETELQFHMGQFDTDGADPTAAPHFEMAPVGSEAPTFAAETAAPPVAGNTAFQPRVAAVALPLHEPPKNSLPSAAASPLPDLPPLPTIPPALSTAPSRDAVPSAVTDGAAAPSSSVMSAESHATLPPAASAPDASESPAQSSLFSATRLSVQAALDRGELSQGLLLLSDWYGDPSLSPSENSELNALLGQLAGSVIYSTEHRLEPPYMVQAGERLETIAKEYEVPWQLLAKINGITSADPLQAGQSLKVVRGPFSALIDLRNRKMTLMLDRRYAGRFSLDVDLHVTVEEGHWEVNQKLLTPASATLPGVGPTTPTEERSLMLSSSNGSATQVTILRGITATNPLAEPAGRVLRMNRTDVADVFDILSLGSKVVIRR